MKINNILFILLYKSKTNLFQIRRSSWVKVLLPLLWFEGWIHRRRKVGASSLMYTCLITRRQVFCCKGKDDIPKHWWMMIDDDASCLSSFMHSFHYLDFSTCFLLSDTSMHVWTSWVLQIGWWIDGYWFRYSGAGWCPVGQFDTCRWTKGALKEFSADEFWELFFSIMMCLLGCTNGNRRKSCRNHFLSYAFVVISDLGLKAVLRFIPEVHCKVCKCNCAASLFLSILCLAQFLHFVSDNLPFLHFSIPQFQIVLC